MFAALVVALAAAAVSPAVAAPHGIAFVAGRDAFIRTPSGAVRRLTRHHDVDGLAWSPDRRSLLLMRLVQFEPTDYRVTRYELGRRRERPFLEHAYDPAWSPNGKRVAFARGNDVWVADPAVRWSGRDLGLGYSPAWSPDGRRLAYQWTGIGVRDADGARASYLTQDGEEPAWSPDGRTIAFVRFSTEIWTMHADGTGLRRLVSGSAPTWSPNGRRIAFWFDKGGIASIRPDGSGLRRLTRTPGRMEEPFDWR
jgi:TolB protein